VQVLQDSFYVLLHVLFYLWSLLHVQCGRSSLLDYSAWLGYFGRVAPTRFTRFKFDPRVQIRVWSFQFNSAAPPFRLQIRSRRMGELTACNLHRNCNYFQGRSDGGGYRYLYPPPPKKKISRSKLLWGKNDVRTAIQQFYTPQKTYTPKTNFWLRPWLFRLFCRLFILLVLNSLINQTVNDGVDHSKNPRKCAYHVTFDLDLDLEHTLDACWPGVHLVKVWWRSGQLSARRSDLRKSLQTDGRTDDGRRAIALAHCWNELKKLFITKSNEFI